jgi:lipocalin
MLNFNHVACIAGFLAAVTASRLSLAPVQVINATKYLGRWYQMYSDAFVEDTFEYDSYCDTADCT